MPRIMLPQTGAWRRRADVWLKDRIKRTGVWCRTCGRVAGDGPSERCPRSNCRDNR